MGDQTKLEPAHSRHQAAKRPGCARRERAGHDPAGSVGRSAMTWGSPDETGRAWTFRA